MEGKRTRSTFSSNSNSENRDRSRMRTDFPASASASSSSNNRQQNSQSMMMNTNSASSSYANPRVYIALDTSNIDTDGIIKRLKELSKQGNLQELDIELTWHDYHKLSFLDGLSPSPSHFASEQKEVERKVKEGEEDDDDENVFFPQLVSFSLVINHVYSGAELKRVLYHDSKDRLINTAKDILQHCKNITNFVFKGADAHFPEASGNANQNQNQNQNQNADDSEKFAKSIAQTMRDYACSKLRILKFDCLNLLGHLGPFTIWKELLLYENMLEDSIVKPSCFPELDTLIVRKTLMTTNILPTVKTLSTYTEPDVEAKIKTLFPNLKYYSSSSSSSSS